ncbi:uncharacterized protein K02A2.6-like [Eupeodes corollae]|uniref:uncharacterized protein K02A2.6-like n=1 Tax=Eupeodes corollae TaxID=290404 RepID=UPI00249043DC|nr:uncharacterized protein K02A2.6-like [Eupeodes corollae]
MLHEGHWGIVRMKQLARRYCWWPKVDQAIEERASNCKVCQSSAADPPKEYSSWPTPERPWQRVHIDYAGPFVNQMWLICIDAYSKFPFVVPMKNSTTTTATIQALTKIFTLEGLPETLVSDNGPQFASSAFTNFCKQNGIQHLRTAPFHPDSNGEAERFVRTFKTHFKKIFNENPKKDLALSRCLSTYRTTPNPKSGKSPAELLHGRQHRSIISQLIPERHSNTTSSQLYIYYLCLYSRK